MKAEEYFEFEKFNTKFGPVERIRIKGHRIAIENVIEYYNAGKTAEHIQQEVYPSLTLDEVNAAITYYLHNKEAVDAYFGQGEKIAEAWYQDYLKYGPSFLKDKAGECATPPPSDLPAHE
jgi:uncharacterized protein (DUF433 family)